MQEELCIELKVNFVCGTRCLKTELVSEVSQLLDETGISGSSICEAFTLVSAAILSHEDVNLQTLAGSFSSRVKVVG